MNARLKPLLELAALLMIVAFPLWGIIWYVSSDFGATTSATAAAPAASGATSSARIGAGQTGVLITLNDEASLPRYVTSGQVVPFSFTLADTGSLSGSFSYKVYVVWGSGEQDVIDENSVQLAAGGSASIPESLKFETASARGEIHIETASPDESIVFRLPRP